MSSSVNKFHQQPSKRSSDPHAKQHTVNRMVWPANPSASDARIPLQKATTEKLTVHLPQLKGAAHPSLHSWPASQARYHTPHTVHLLLMSRKVNSDPRGLLGPLPPPHCCSQPLHFLCTNPHTSQAASSACEGSPRILRYTLAIDKLYQTF